MVIMLARIPNTSSSTVATAEVDQRVAIAALPFIFPVAAEETGRNLRDNAGDKDNEGVHHPPGSGSW